MQKLIRECDTSNLAMDSRAICSDAVRFRSTRRGARTFREEIQLEKAAQKLFFSASRITTIRRGPE